MLLDKLKNMDLYIGIYESISYVLKAFEQNDFTRASPGKYDSNDKGIFYLIQEYETKSMDEALFEAHRKYIDVMYIVEGSECIGLRNVNELDEQIPYDEEKDIAFYSGNGDFLTLKAGDFFVLYPEDAHMPCISPDNKQRVKKVVFKIPFK